MLLGSGLGPRYFRDSLFVFGSIICCSHSRIAMVVGAGEARAKDDGVDVGTEILRQRNVWILFLLWEAVPPRYERGPTRMSLLLGRHGYSSSPTPCRFSRCRLTLGCARAGQLSALLMGSEIRGAGRWHKFFSNRWWCTHVSDLASAVYRMHLTPFTPTDTATDTTHTHTHTHTTPTP